MQIFKDIVSSESSVSSARSINILGACVASAVLIWDTVTNGAVRNEAFGMFLAYCAGVYSYGKKLDKEKVNEKVN